ncbi:MAG TPA: hypothetical protein VFR97_11455 [Capillimicrobium sp.]|nr:hypothetical protein [Capillimicrobium sp.]
MRARLNQKIERLRPSTARRGAPRPERPEPRLEPRPQCIAPTEEPADPEDRVREAGGPEDRAQYSCSCGLVFTAPVSASVQCPHCGAGQAW